MKFLFFFSALLSLSLHAHMDPSYDIVGDSPKLDANLSDFLNQWRINTISSVQNGECTNVVVNGPTASKSVTFTFDDSPDENITFAVLDVLKRYNVKASFFMVGNTMNEINATAVTRASEEGHLVLNHSFSHSRLTKLDCESITHELNTTAKRIHELTGHYPLLMRPPYGSINPEVANTINTQGYTTILWSLDSLDWAIKDEEAIAANVIVNVRPGEIILMHAGRSNTATPAALVKIIETLRTQGYSFQRLDEMLGIKPYL